MDDFELVCEKIHNDINGIDNTTKTFNIKIEEIIEIRKQNQKKNNLTVNLVPEVTSFDEKCKVISNCISECNFWDIKLGTVSELDPVGISKVFSEEWAQKTMKTK